MRGDDHQQGGMFSYLSPEQRVPQDHPLRAIRAMVDAVLREMSPQFDAMYCGDRAAVDCAGEAAAGAAAAGAVHGAQRAAADGAVGLQPAVPLVCGAEHGRSGVGADGVHQESGAAAGRGYGGSSSSKRWWNSSGAGAAEDEHFTVDGTLMEAWAGAKSFKRKDGTSEPPEDRGNPTVDFHGEKRANDTHQSTTDPDARLAKKAKGKEAKLSYAGHVLMENRNGLIVKTRMTKATGTAECTAALEMAEEVSGERRVTLGGDKGYDQKKLVEALRVENVTPHVAQNAERRGGSAIDERTTRHEGYQISQRKRKRVEEIFGWMKTIGLMRKLRHRGEERVEWMFTFTAAAYNLVRARNLLAQAKA